MELSDLSPSTVEFLEKEKFCLDEPHNSIDKFIGQKSKIEDCNSTHSEPCSTPLVSSSDDEIGSFIEKMKELLSPKDLEYLKANEGKDVEVLIKETEDFIQNSSPLFLNLSASSKSTNNQDKTIDSSSGINESNESPDNLLDRTKKLAEVTSDLVSAVTAKSVPKKVEQKVTELTRNAIVQHNMDENGSVEDLNLKNNVNIYKEDRSNNSSKSEVEFLNSTNQKQSDIDNKSDELSNNDNSFEKKISNGSLISSSVHNIGEQIENDNNFSETNINDCNFPIKSNESLLRNHSSENNISSHLKSSELSVFVGVLYELDSNMFNEAQISQINLAFQKYENKYKKDVELMRMEHEAEISRLIEHIDLLKSKLENYESTIAIENGAGDNRNVIGTQVKKNQELLTEIEKQDHLIAGYQRENQKLFNEINISKELWKREKLQLEEKIRAGIKMDDKNLILQDQLKDAQETIVKYQLELENSKELWRQEKNQLEEKIKAASSLDNKNFILQNQLKDTQEMNVKYQLELENFKMGKINDEIMKWQKHTNNNNSIESSELSSEIDSLKVTITQLQAVLNVERTEKKNISRDKELLVMENLDLKRQIKEVEGILKRRSHSDSSLTKGVGEAKFKELEKELLARQATLSAMQTQLEDMQVKYNDHINELEHRLKINQEENNNLKLKLNEVCQQNSQEYFSCQISKQNQGSQNLIQPSTALSQNNRAAISVSTKEDAHLLATIRGMKLEIAKKEKDMIKLNKELEDARKTNRRLQREREKQLKTNSQQKQATLQNANMVKIDNKEITTSGCSKMSEKPYNQDLFQEHEEETAILKLENKNLKDEIQRLSQDIVTLHTKRIHDLRMLQSEHEKEIHNLLNDYSSRHSQSTVTELQSQIYTQQMVITHLKEQIKQMSDLKEENTMLKLERDHLEKTLIGSNKRILELQKPESLQYQNLLEKFENLEQRHEVREQKLQSIVKDLLARCSETVPCGPACRSKLLDKNREICYYRLEMDRILEALREFKRSK